MSTTFRYPGPIMQLISIEACQMNPTSGTHPNTPEAYLPLQAPTMALSVINAAISSLRNAIGSDKKQKASLNKMCDAFKAVAR
jgi:hypothetical protein